MVTAPDQGLRDFILIKLTKLEMSRMQESFAVLGTRHLCVPLMEGSQCSLPGVTQPNLIYICTFPRMRSFLVKRPEKIHSLHSVCRNRKLEEIKVKCGRYIFWNVLQQLQSNKLEIHKAT